MSFKYLVCVDFEATGWEGYGTRKEDAEIIGMDSPWNFSLMFYKRFIYDSYFIF